MVKIALHLEATLAWVDMHNFVPGLVVLCPILGRLSLFCAMPSQYKLAKLWERVRRVRKRFEKNKPWIIFPPVNDTEDSKNGKKDPRPMSTAALAMNAEAVSCIVETYGPNPVAILPLQQQVCIHSKGT